MNNLDTQTKLKALLRKFISSKQQKISCIKTKRTEEVTESK